MLAPLKKLFAISLNAGWIVPLYLSVNAVIQWCRLEASPVIYGTEGIVNSFPFLQFAQTTLIVACIFSILANDFTDAVETAATTCFASGTKRRKRGASIAVLQRMQPKLPMALSPSVRSRFPGTAGRFIKSPTND